ncbi:hypothetical protein ABL78_4871 [Leptomonas seymouri]|uniref:Uncharacterized protein n=1 Tax=Leptomonas seymouri TaxID=5684 RepID=A0A0N0P556_LEPSE|nr:hypothetical protein ABL78_4871 [Leptomonas seymouri]|eukprot:KPI86069.1 hypothetical protein ABL78_4871 [Leptomonas seymouri]
MSTAPAPPPPRHTYKDQLFFTGRLAELHELRPSEMSRHNTADGSAEDIRRPDTPLAAHMMKEGEGGMSGKGERANSKEEGGGLQLARNRGIPGEFNVPNEDDSNEGNTLPLSLSLYKYTITASHAPPALLPHVVVRAEPAA